MTIPAFAFTFTLILIFTTDHNLLDDTPVLSVWNGYSIHRQFGTCHRSSRFHCSGLTDFNLWLFRSRKKRMFVFLFYQKWHESFWRFLKKQILATNVFEGSRRMPPSDWMVLVTKGSPTSTMNNKAEITPDLEKQEWVGRRSSSSSGSKSSSSRSSRTRSRS